MKKRYKHKKEKDTETPRPTFAFRSVLVDETDAALEAAAQVGWDANAYDVRRYQGGSNKPCMANVFLASTGTKGKSIVEERRESVDTRRARLRRSQACHWQSAIAHGNSKRRQGGSLVHDYQRSTGRLRKPTPPQNGDVQKSDDNSAQAQWRHFSLSRYAIP